MDLLLQEKMDSVWLFRLLLEFHHTDIAHLIIIFVKIPS